MNKSASECRKSFVHQIETVKLKIFYLKLPSHTMNKTRARIFTIGIAETTFKKDIVTIKDLLI